MKKTEAISILATSARPREPKDRARYDEAVRMAIEALKCSETPNSSDCISRQAAIDAQEAYMADHPLDEYEDELALIDILRNLPSAQPDNQINLCDSCDYLYPDCPAKYDDVIFGNGIGNDNIYACNKYKPSAKPDRKLIDDCMWKIKQNISSHTAAEGVVAIKYYLEQIYEQIYGEGEKPKWMT